MRSIGRETLGGWSMIAGAVLGLVTMAFHPSNAAQAALGLTVHGLALFSVSIAFYGVSSVAALLAATASGLLAPDLIAGAEALDRQARAAAANVVRYNYAVNQAFAKVLVAASSAAIGQWSLEIVRTRLMRRAAGILGCVVAALALLALFSGHLTLDVHGFGAIVLAQAIWLILVGAELRHTAPAATAPRG